MSRIFISLVALLAATEAVAQCVECAQQMNNAFTSSQTVRNSQDAAQRAGRFRQPARGADVDAVLRKYPGLRVHREQRGARTVLVACAERRTGGTVCRDVG